MITRNNKILLGILTFILSITIGYAVFTQSVTVTGSATSNGTLQVQATCQPGITTEMLNAIGLRRDLIPEGGYENDTCSTSGNDVSFSVDLLFPGAIRVFQIQFKNTGTINAKINIENDIHDNSELCIYEGLEHECYSSSMSGFGYVANYAFEFLTVSGPDDILLSSEEIENSNFLDGDYVILRPGDSFYGYIPVQWNEDWDNESFMSGETYVVTNVNYSFDFEQYTN